MSFHFKVIETFTVNAHYGALRDESVGVYVVDHSIKKACFALFGDHDQYFQVVARVVTVGVYNRTSAMRRVCCDALAYLIVTLGDNKKLHRTAS